MKNCKVITIIKSVVCILMSHVFYLLNLKHSCILCKDVLKKMSEGAFKMLGQQEMKGERNWGSIWEIG